MTVLFAGNYSGAFNMLSGDSGINSVSSTYYDSTFVDGAMGISNLATTTGTMVMDAYLGSVQSSFWTHMSATIGSSILSFVDNIVFGGWNSGRDDWDFYFQFTDGVSLTCYYWNGSSYTNGGSFPLVLYENKFNVDIYFYKHASAGEISFYLEGQTSFSITGLDTSNFSTDSFRFGPQGPNWSLSVSQFIIADECTIGWRLFTPDLKAAADPIQFVGAKFQSLAGAASGTTTIALNSGLTGGIDSAVAANDIVIAVFGVASTVDRTLVIDDGTTNYTLLASELYANDTIDMNLRVAYKRMGGSPDTSVRFGNTGSTADGGVIGVYVFRGVDTTTALDVSATSGTGTNSSNADPPSITPVTYGAAIVAVFGGAFNGSISAFTDPNNLLNLTQGFNNTDTNRVRVGAGWMRWVSGATNLTAMVSPDTNLQHSWGAVTIALRPVAVASTFSTPGAISDVAVDYIQSNNGYIASATADQINYYSLEDMPSVSGEVKAVVLNTRALKGDTGPQKINGVARVGGTNYHKSDVTLTDAVDPVSVIWATNPGTSAVWTFNDVNDLTLGVRSRT